MKFFYNLKIDNNLFVEDINDFTNFFDYFFEKKMIKKRKFLIKSRPGIIKNIKKSSIFRDKNVSVCNNYINLNQKKGNKIIFFNNFNNALENINYYLMNNDNFSKTTKINIIPDDIDYFFLNTYTSYECIFEIKSIKNNNKKNSNNKNKFTHEIVYIPKEKRFKHLLKAFSFYKEKFKNYKLWERLFWSFFFSLEKKSNFFLKKRKEYIYSKSIKFFKNKK